MRYVWDPKKNAANISKHHIDFEDAPRFFDQPYFEEIDDRVDYGEERYKALGRIDSIPCVIVFTEPDPGIRRIISVRPANRQERAAYEAEIKNQLGPSSEN